MHHQQPQLQSTEPSGVRGYTLLILVYYASRYQYESPNLILTSKFLFVTFEKDRNSWLIAQATVMIKPFNRLPVKEPLSCGRVPLSRASSLRPIALHHRDKMGKFQRRNVDAVTEFLDQTYLLIGKLTLECRRPFIARTARLAYYGCGSVHRWLGDC